MNLTVTSSRDAAGTPMLKQYHAIKSQHQDCILLFRLGDFYEMFYEDAKVVAAELDLVLTSRGKGSANHVPMCGFPHHAAEGYIARLIKAGYKVALCDQMEDPALAKGIVRRDVTRVITSGTFLDDSTSESRLLLCLFPLGGKFGMASCDATTGAILTNEFNDTAKMINLIARQSVLECVYPDSAQEIIKELFSHPLLKLKNISLSPFEDWHFNNDLAKKYLCAHFGVHNLSGFGIDALPLAVTSCSALLEYFKQMNKQPLSHIDKIAVYTENDFMFISAAAHHGLELERLIKTLDHTSCALGRRTFHFWFTHPLKDVTRIRERQDAVGRLLEHKPIQQDLQSLLSKVPDLEKNLSRISCGYTNPKDLLSLRHVLQLIPAFQELLVPLRDVPFFNIADIRDLRELLASAVNEEMPLTNSEGKVIRRGFHREIDELREIHENGRQWLKLYQEKEIKRSGINSLKVGYNKIFGFYIEITNTHLKNVPADYMRKQTLVNGERYITPELKSYEEKILSAEDKILKIESTLIKDLCQKILARSLALHQYAESLATLDALLALSFLAQSRDYIRPAVNDDALIDIKEGRHPVVEKQSTEQFIANDTLLNCSDNHLIILTGPNMAGKSTYIRQTAILTLMAQVGSHIPARSANIGIVDKIFTRIGAHDDISRGQSTFMVEMNEMADILNNLTERSLIILDEIGRGTSTYDGLSLAWALAEHLAKAKARTLFATHFHELIALAAEHPGIKNYNVAVKEWKDEIVFLHKIVPGGSDDSYGIHVAKLAGIPAKVIERSRKILMQLELQNNAGAIHESPEHEQQLNLFSAADPVLTEIKETIEAMDINNLTPMQALNELQKIKDRLNNP